MCLEATDKAENNQKTAKKTRLSALQAVNLLAWSAINFIAPGKPRLLRVSSFKSLFSANYNKGVPAKAGIQRVRRLTPHWIPAFAGMTKVGYGRFPPRMRPSSLICMRWPETTDRRRSAFHNLVIPAKAGIQSVRRLTPHWIPAFAGMTKVDDVNFRPIADILSSSPRT